MKEKFYPSREQMQYADLLFYGCWAGLIIMILTYAAYISGLVAPHVPPEDIPRYWSQPVAHYLREAHVPTGWGWVKLLKQGDFLNFIGIVLLAGLSMICYLRLIPSLLRKKDFYMAAIAVAEVIVMLVAASGIAGSGGH